MRETFSPDSCAAEVAHRYRQASTGSVVVNAMLPRRHCLKAHFKKNKQEGSVGVWFVWACTWGGGFAFKHWVVGTGSGRSQHGRLECVVWKQVDMFRSRSRDGLGLSLRVAGRLASPFGFLCVHQDELSCRSGEC